jgi:hypothetical protein
MVLTVHPPEPCERLAELILSCDVSDLAVLWTAGKMAEPSMVRLSEAGVAGVQGEDAVTAAHAQLAVALGDAVADVEINPLVVHPTGATAVDGLLLRA